MKLLFDQNLSHRLTAQLAVDYPGSVHVRDFNLASADDQDVWDCARVNGFAIASKDADFEQRAMLYGHPPKVIWIRTGNCSTASIATLLKSRQGDLLAFDADPTEAILILS
ncbi:MAG: DUF5615 family PIN-like protein [Planctomycetes bacterium]|nr:DUF5615 family PIN-like protein [Planctomycetota bacterium]